MTDILQNYTVAPSPSNLSCDKHTDRSKFYIIRTIHAAIAVISMMGSMSVIVYCVYRRTFRNSNVRPVFHLALADFLLSASWLTGTVLWTMSQQNDSQLPNSLGGLLGLSKDQKFDSCLYLQIITEGIHLITFFLTVNYSVNIFIKIRDRLNSLEGLIPVQKSWTIRYLMKAFCAFSWIIPGALITPVLIYINPEDPSNCIRCLFLVSRPGINANCSDYFLSDHFWLCEDYGSLVFVVSILLCVLVMVILYVRVACVYRTLVNYDSNKWTDKERLRVKLMKKRVVLYVIAFLICWIPACIIAVMHLHEVYELNLNHDYVFALFILQGITAPSQGLLNSIVYAWTHRQFRYSIAVEKEKALPLPSQFNRRSYGTMISQITTQFPRQRPYINNER